MLYFPDYIYKKGNKQIAYWILNELKNYCIYFFNKEIKPNLTNF